MKRKIVIVTSYEFPPDEKYGEYLPECKYHPRDIERVFIPRIVKEFYQDKKHPNGIHIFTMSTYVFIAINNRIEAFKAGQIDPEEASRIYPSEQWINPDDIIAYHITEDNKQINLFDEEDKILMVDIFDDVSDEIGIKLGRLIDISCNDKLFGWNKR